MEPRPPHRTTITEVARAAGVAPSTVSRAFTRPGRVNQVTRSHVMAVAAKLGYAPSRRARGAESGRTNMVALLVPDITNPYFAGVIKGVERAAEAAGMVLVLGDTQESPANEARLLRRLGDSVDGFVISAPRSTNAALVAAAESKTIVLINRAVPGIACVVADFDSGARQIVDHLASLGHGAFAFLGGPPESWSGARRWAALQTAAEAAGLGATRLGAYAPTITGGAPAADAAVARGATAVVAHNDLLAIGVILRLRARGLGVPEDMSVVGFDNVTGADFCDPPLTTLAERTADAGSRAFDAVVAQVYVRSTEPATRVLPTRLVIRQSTGSMPSGSRPGHASAGPRSPGTRQIGFAT